MFPCPNFNNEKNVIKWELLHVEFLREKKLPNPPPKKKPLKKQKQFFLAKTIMEKEVQIIFI